MIVPLSRPPAQPALTGIDALRAEFAAQIGRNTVYFVSGSAQLGGPATAVLQAQAMWLRRHPEITVRIEGHADPGDTRDHALAVGARRAEEVRNYLVLLGVPAAQLSATSWGKERPGAGRAVTMLVVNPGSRGRLRRAAVVPAVAQPRARLALGFGDFASGHFKSDLGAAFLTARQPDRAARLNHLCASMRSTSTPPRPVEKATPSSNKASTSPRSASASRLRIRNSALF